MKRSRDKDEEKEGQGIKDSVQKGRGGEGGGQEYPFFLGPGNKSIFAVSERKRSKRCLEERPKKVSFVTLSSPIDNAKRSV